MSARLTDRVAEMVATQLANLGRDDVHYEVTVQVVPTPQGQVPMLGLMLTFPAVIIGQWSSTMGMIPNLCPPKEAIEEAVLKMLEGLRNNHELERQAVKAQANGSRLIIPGQP